MRLLSWLHQRMTARPQTRPTPARKPSPRLRPRLETLEGRDVPSFAAPVTYAVAPPQALVTADVNGDGKADLLSLDANGSMARVLLNNGNGTFGTPRFAFVPPGLTATAIAVGDVNADGKLDVVFADHYGASDPVSPPPTYPGAVSVLLGDGRGGFTRTDAQFILPANVTALALADVNSDGKLDVVTGSAPGGVAVALSKGHGTFGNSQSYNSGLGLYGVGKLALGDVNGDGKPDVVASARRANNVSVLLNTGTGTFGAAQTYTIGVTPTALAVGDVSGDGKLDVVTANSNGTVSVILGQGNGAFAAVHSYALGGPANSVALGDFNHDGRLDVATTGGTETDVLLNAGNGTFAAYQKVGPAGSSVVASDFNGDGSPDLAQAGSTNASILAVLLNNADWKNN